MPVVEVNWLVMVADQLPKGVARNYEGITQEYLGTTAAHVYLSLQGIAGWFFLAGFKLGRNRMKSLHSHGLQYLCECSSASYHFHWIFKEWPKLMWILHAPYLQWRCLTLYKTYICWCVLFSKSFLSRGSSVNQLRISAVFIFGGLSLGMSRMMFTSRSLAPVLASWFSEEGQPSIKEIRALEFKLMWACGLFIVSWLTSVKVWSRQTKRHVFQEWSCQQYGAILLGVDVTSKDSWAPILPTLRSHIKQL